MPLVSLQLQLVTPTYFLWWLQTHPLARSTPLKLITFFFFFKLHKTPNCLPSISVVLHSFFFLSSLLVESRLHGLTSPAFVPFLHCKFHGAGQRTDLFDAEVVLRHHRLAHDTWAVTVEEGVNFVGVFFPDERVDGTEPWFEEFDGFVECGGEICIYIEFKINFLCNLIGDILKMLIVLFEVDVPFWDDLQWSVEVEFQFFLHVHHLV